MNEKLELICSIVKRSAARARDDASFGGRHDDSGASGMESRLDAFLDGVNFATTGESKLYNHILIEHEKKLDPEYQEYLRLKEKFK